MDLVTTSPRYLTKSRFALALECPTKLFYTGKKQYANRKLDDPFLLALAEGGFQVGELAKRYFPGGHEVRMLEYDLALDKTSQHLAENRTIQYEAAVRHAHLFIRADILIKDGNRLELIEVKAKSFDTSVEEPFYTKKGTIRPEWRSYLHDVAFQKYVLSKAFPDYQVSAYLMMTDKNAVCQTDGLNQKFKIARDQDGRKKIVVPDTLTDADLSRRLLCQINVDNICSDIYQGMYKVAGSALSYGQWLDYLAEHYQHDEKIAPIPSKICASCEFKAHPDDIDAGKLCGFRECWSESLGWKQQDFTHGSVLDIWDLRTKDKLINNGCIRISDLTEEDIKPEDDDSPGYPEPSGSGCKSRNARTAMAASGSIVKVFAGKWRAGLIHCTS
jgi:hypothetical protein